MTKIKYNKADIEKIGMKINDLRKIVKQTEEEIQILQSSALEAFYDLDIKELKTSLVSILLVEPESYHINLDALTLLLETEKIEKTKVFERKIDYIFNSNKLVELVKEGKLTAKQVAAVTETKYTKPYLKVSFPGKKVDLFEDIKEAKRVES